MSDKPLLESLPATPPADARPNPSLLTADTRAPHPRFEATDPIVGSSEPAFGARDSSVYLGVGLAIVTPFAQSLWPVFPSFISIPGFIFGVWLILFGQWPRALRLYRKQRHRLPSILSAVAMLVGWPAFIVNELIPLWHGQLFEHIAQLTPAGDTVGGLYVENKLPARESGISPGAFMEMFHGKSAIEARDATQRFDNKIMHVSGKVNIVQPTSEGYIIVIIDKDKVRVACSVDESWRNIISKKVLGIPLSFHGTIVPFSSDDYISLRDCVFEN